MVLVYKQQSHLYGLGDTLRSIFAFYCFCLEKGVTFMICFDQVYKPYFACESCIDDVSIPTGYVFTDKMDNRVNIMLNLASTGHTIVVTSNLYEFVPWSVKDRYRSSFLDFLKINVKPLITEDFVAIHVRAGDRYMNKINCLSDSRIEPDVAKLNTEYAINLLRQQHGNETRIVVFTDNNYIKNCFKEYTLDTVVGHSVFNIGVKDAIEEFVTLTKAKKIVMLSHSGFSFWASYFGLVHCSMLNIYMSPVLSITG